jgi:hypothetical protein
MLYVNNTKNENDGCKTYQTPKTKKAFYTHIKHPKQKRRFIHVENTQYEKGGLYTLYKTPKTKKVVYTRRKHPKRKYKFLQV